MTSSIKTSDNTHAANKRSHLDDPGPENQVLLRQNPSSNTPPATDHGNTGPLWYSFDLAPKRVQPGGWTHQVTQRELPPSTDIAGVNMRLTQGSFRELHWHKANEWALMLTGKARVSVFQGDGKMSTRHQQIVLNICPSKFASTLTWKTSLTLTLHHANSLPGSHGSDAQSLACSSC